MIFIMYECEEKLGYTFKDKTLLRTCFTHSSYSHEHGGKNNERLEFFGDSILGFVVTEYLFGKFTDEGEGRLTLYKQQIVSRKPLAEAIVRLGLNDYILFGVGEKKNSPEHHEAACENLYEALVAGIYLDGGEEEARKFIKRTLLAYFRPLKQAAEGNSKVVPPKTGNFKGLLQEYVQKNKLGEIVYKEIGKSGPPHDPVFSVSVSIGGNKIGSGNGKKKSEAEQSAAKFAYIKLTEGTDGDERPKKSNGKQGGNEKSAKKGKAVKKVSADFREKTESGGKAKKSTDAKNNNTKTTGEKPLNNKKSGARHGFDPKRRKIK